uniref:nucleotidyltransferase family protein n=1 Tax=Algoriphagus sp. TaxID=1872435 RepID=UPI0040474F69
MKVILLAAGFGTRLRPITNVIPKCLVPIKGKPLLQIWLERLNEAGISSFLINTHYLHSQVEDFVKSSNFYNCIVTVYESQLLGTAGTLLANLKFFDGDDGLFIHADNYCLADFQAFIIAHKNRPKHCLMTMMIFQTDNPSSCGIVELNEENVVIGFHEKIASPPGNLANGAIYIISKEMLILLDKEFNTSTDFSTEILPYFVGQIFTYQTSDFFLDIGTPEAFEKANKTVDV